MTVLTAYQHAWSAAPSPGAVEYWLARCWRRDSCYLNPFVDPVQGMEGLIGLIVDYAVVFPDLRIHPVGVPMITGDRARYRWAMRSSQPIQILGVDYGRVMYGRDVVVFAGDGRIKLAVASFDPVRVGNPGDDQ